MKRYAIKSACLCICGTLLFGLTGCGKNVTINDIGAIDKTPVVTVEETKTEKETKVEKQTEPVKTDYSWANYDVVSKIYAQFVDSEALIDFYIASSQDLWANASPNFKLDIKKDDAYFWNTINYDDFSDFLKDYYKYVGFGDVPDYVVQSMANIVSYDMIWNSLTQDWTKIDSKYINEGIGLGYSLKMKHLPSTKVKMCVNTSVDDMIYMYNDTFAHYIGANNKFVQACEYGSGGAYVAYMSQSYAKSLGLTSNVEVTGVNYLYANKDDGGLYFDRDTDGDGVPNFRSLITVDYMKAHKDSPSGFLYYDGGDEVELINYMNDYVGTDVIYNYEGLIKDIESGVAGIYTYPYGQPTPLVTLDMTNRVKTRLELSAGNGTQGSAVASYIYYWKELYGTKSDKKQ